MRVTIITLYDADTGEHHVGALLGEASHQARLCVAEKFDAVYKPGPLVDPVREVFFREVELSTTTAQLEDLYNMHGDES